MPFMHSCSVGLRSRRASLSLVALVSTLLLSLPQRAVAQGPAFTNVAYVLRFRSGSATAGNGVAADALPPVLRQLITVTMRDVTLERALQAIAARAGLDLAYSRAVVPLGRTVSISLTKGTVAEALQQVLRGIPVELWLAAGGKAALVPATPGPQAAADTGAIVGRVTRAGDAPLAGAMIVVEGTARSATANESGRYRIAGLPPGTYTVRARYIGYSPGSATVTVEAERETTADFVLEKSTQRLNELVTTGTVAETEVKALPNPITVIDADEIRDRNVQHVDQLFRGDSPGVFAWNAGTLNYESQFGSIRGSTQLSGGFDQFKVYVDGVEMANGAYLPDLDPSQIERIEVVRGPQASTLYGSQALSGVMQIFTKKGGAGLARPQVEAKAAVGAVESQYSQNTVVSQDYNLIASGGSERASYSIGGSYRKAGRWVPDYGDEYGSAFGSAKLVNGPLTAEFSARYITQTIGVASGPLYPAAVPVLHQNTLRRPHQMYGVTVTYRARPGWEHVVVAGVDRVGSTYAAPELSSSQGGFLNAFDDNKVSLGYYTTLTSHVGEALSTTWTAGLDHWAYSTSQTILSPAPTTSGNIVIPPGAYLGLSRAGWTNTGYYGQLQLGVRNTVFLTTGIRGDQSSNFGADIGTTWAPRVGIAAVHAVGGLNAKLRASYGRAVRPPPFGAASRYAYPGLIQLANPNLLPEEQVGFDAGLELYFGSRASVQVSYYNQSAKNLIDSELLSFDPATATTTSQYVNLGRVKNTGWEFQGTVHPVRALAINGSLSIAHSTIDSLGSGYGGSYQVGDRLLGTPHTSVGGTVSYTIGRTTLGGGLTYVESWINTDWRRLYTDYYVNAVFTNPLRSYWIEYPAITRLRASASQELGNRVTAFAQVENITNRQTGELDNITVTPGRTTTVGMRIRY